MNNVVYISYFDPVIGHYLRREAGLDPLRDAAIGMAVENGCRFHRSLAYPDTVHPAARRQARHVERALRDRHLP